MSDDRKYRQRGYQDEKKERTPRPAAKKPAEPGAPAGARRISQDGPKNINMPGFREVVRCSQCGNPASAEVAFDSRCPRCGTDMHACAQCASFDPGSRFECMETTITARITPKNARNSCTLFSPRTTVERETTAPRTNDARKAFDDLFKS
jgi:hypothetical protein